MSSPEQVKQPPVPEWVPARLQEALQLHQSGRLEEAKQGYEAVLKVAPQQPNALQLLGVLEKRLGNKQKAIGLMRHSLHVMPNQPNVWFNLANTCWEVKQYQEAYVAFKQAAALKPDDVQILFNYGSACREIHAHQEGIAVLKKVLEMQPDYLDALRNLGAAYKAAGMNDEAIACYKKALKNQPDDMKVLVNLGNAYKSAGQFDEAIKAYEKAVELSPNTMEAHRYLMQVKKYKDPNDPHIQQMEEMLASDMTMSLDDRVNSLFALSGAYFSAKAYEKAMDVLDNANREKRSGYNYDVSKMWEWLEAIKTTFTKERMAKGLVGASDSARPIIIVGMPRSGTSLVEQILSSHSTVFGAGELTYLQNLLKQAWSGWTKKIFPHDMDGFTAAHAKAVADGYLEASSQLAPKDAKFIVDKMPDNFRVLGMIHLLFPHAKLIHCRRDSMDTCYSIYRQCFTGAHHYAYNQQELGEYYRFYEAIMEHWREVLPEGALLEVQYEALVDDTEAKTRELLEYCGLEWENSCLEFHKTERAVNTASATQVRQPIYKSSLRSWEPCKEQLKPLREALSYDD